MDNAGLFEGKIVEINDKLNYYVIKQTLYNNIIYLLGNEMIDDETPSEDLAILKVVNQPNGLGVSFENDENIQQELLKIFDQLLEEMETED